MRANGIETGDDEAAAGSTDGAIARTQHENSQQLDRAESKTHRISLSIIPHGQCLFMLELESDGRIARTISGFRSIRTQI